MLILGIRSPSTGLTSLPSMLAKRMLFTSFSSLGETFLSKPLLVVYHQTRVTKTRKRNASKTTTAQMATRKRTREIIVVWTMNHYFSVSLNATVNNDYYSTIETSFQTLSLLYYSESGARAIATLLSVGRSNTLQINRPARINFSKSIPVERPIPCSM